jgi:hypothetical protein
MTARIWVLGLAALPLVACKPKASSDAPYRDVHGWTIAEIEAELAHNDEVLAGEGIMVAMAAPTVAPTVTPPDGPGLTSEEPAETPEIEPTTEPVPSDDDGGGAEPPTEPLPPEPMPTPTSVQPETRPENDRELLSAEGATIDAPTERRRGARRKLSSRSRRDADSRCERVCRLAEATCELETQICELAARHAEESRYQQACLRAEQQCVAASDACQRCEDC